MSARKPPQAWFWSYDIKTDNIDSVLLGVRLMRLSSYHMGAKQRFAALMYEEPGPTRSYALLLDAAEAAARVRDTGHRPVAVTVDTSGEAPRFSLVLEQGPPVSEANTAVQPSAARGDRDGAPGPRPGAPPVTSLHLDLDEAGARALLDGKHAIADLATYTAGGARRYAVIVEERAAQSWLITGATAGQVDEQLLAHGAVLVRARPYVEGGRRLFAAVAERVDPGAWAWYSGLSPDAVAESLEKNKAYPVDLDAWWENDALRFCVVMYRDPKE